MQILTIIYCQQNYFNRIQNNLTMNLLFALSMLIVYVWTYQFPPFLSRKSITIPWNEIFTRFQINNQIIMSLTVVTNFYQWNISNYQSIGVVKKQLSDSKELSLYLYQDFTLDQQSCMGATTFHLMTIKNLTSNIILFTYLYENSNNLLTIIGSEMTKNKFYILTNTGQIRAFTRNITNQLYNYQSYYLPSVPFNTPNKYQTTKFVVCQANLYFQYVVLWTLCNNIQIISNRNGTFKIQYNFTGQNSTCTSNIDNIKFNQNCTLVIIERDNLKPITILDLTTMTIFSTITTPTKKVYKAEFRKPQSSNQLLVYYQNNSIIFYDLLQGTSIFLYQLVARFNLSPLSILDTVNYKLYGIFSNNSYLNYFFIDTYVNIQYNNTKTNNTSNQNNTINTTQIQDNNPNNTTDQDEKQSKLKQILSYMQSAQSKTKFGQILQKNLEAFSNFLQKIFPSQIAKQITQVSLKILTLTAVVAQISPLAQILLGFINFWYFCSFYALIQNVYKPNSLTNFINTIFMVTHASQFDFLNLDITIHSGLDDKFHTGFFNSFYISSDFIQTHFQDFIATLLSLLIITILVFVRSKLPLKSWIAQKIKFNVSIAIFAQLIAILPGFLFPFNIIFSLMNFSIFGDKLNIISHILFVNIMFWIPFGVLICTKNNQQTKITKSKITQLSKLTDPQIRQQIRITKSKIFIEQQRQQHKQRSDLSYYGLGGFFLPLAIIVNIKNLIFIVGILLYSFRLYKVQKSKSKFRTNNIILECHILAFHLIFFLMIVLQSYPLIVNFLGHVCIILLIIGSSHWTLNMVHQFFYPLYIWLKKYLKQNQVTNQTKQSDIKIQNNNKSIAKKHIIIKRKSPPQFQRFQQNKIFKNQRSDIKNQVQQNCLPSQSFKSFFNNFKRTKIQKKQEINNQNVYKKQNVKFANKSINTQKRRIENLTEAISNNFQITNL